jgi:hypothetical protein
VISPLQLRVKLGHGTGRSLGQVVDFQILVAPPWYLSHGFAGRIEWGICVLGFGSSYCRIYLHLCITVINSGCYIVESIVKEREDNMIIPLWKTSSKASLTLSRNSCESLTSYMERIRSG